MKEAADPVKDALRILHVEDDSTDAELLRRVLHSGGLPCTINCVRTREDFQAALSAGGFDLIVSDFTLPRFDDALPGFIPTNFTAAFYINNTNSMIAGGFDYTGRVSILKSPVTESYAADLRMVRIDLTWKSGSVVRTREMTTFISKYGLQNYIY